MSGNSGGFVAVDAAVQNCAAHNADAAHEGGDGTVDKGFRGTDFHVDKIGGFRQAGDQVYKCPVLSALGGQVHCGYSQCKTDRRW